MKVIYIDILVRWTTRRIFSWPIPMPIKVPITLYLLFTKAIKILGLLCFKIEIAYKTFIANKK